MDIETFRQIAMQQQGFQRLSRFRVRIFLPSCLLNLATLSGQPYSSLGRYLEFWISSADLPGVLLLTHSINRYGYGPSERKPGAPAFNDIMLTIYNDGNNNNLNMFHDWFNSIINFNMQNGITTQSPLNLSSAYEVAYKTSYITDIEFALFDQSDNITYTMIMREAYPIALPDTKFVAQPQPTVMQITVMLTYFDWATVDMNGLNSSLQQNIQDSTATQAQTSAIA